MLPPEPRFVRHNGCDLIDKQVHEMVKERMEEEVYSLSKEDWRDEMRMFTEKPLSRGPLGCNFVLTIRAGII